MLPSLIKSVLKCALMYLLMPVAAVPGETQDPLYTSLAGMRFLQRSTEEYAHVVDQFIEATRANLTRLQTLVEELRDSSRSGGLYDVEHPVGAYKLIQTWQQIADSISNAENVQEFQKRLNSATLPQVDEREKRGSAAAVLRLQRTYNLTIPQLVAGEVAGRQAAPLTLDDVDFLGQLALDLKDYGLVAEWYQYALEVAPLDDKLNSRFLFYLGRGHYFIGDYERAINFTQRALDLDPSNATIRTYVEHYENRQRQAQRFPGSWPESTLDSWQREVYPSKFRYEALCRGENTTTITDNKNLYCRYRNTAIPYAKVKEEVLSEDPRVMMLHAVISEKDMNHMKREAYPLLHRSGVGDPSKPLLTEERVSQVGWLWDFNLDGVGDSPMKRMSQLVELYTGLRTEYRTLHSFAEPFQVLNYGLGGQYEPHYDFFEDPTYVQHLPEYLQNTGDRIATFMFYLSDVKEGGATVFPNINVYVPPVKGAAAFWYNVKRSGELDHRTQHAGCPVLMGEKWVANKWIRERGQQDRRPCGLSPDTIDD